MENNKSESSATLNKSRRKLLDGLVKAAPVISSMSVLPVWSSYASISGHMSGNTSGISQLTVVDGCSPGRYHMKSNGKGVLSNSEYQKKFYQVFEASPSGVAPGNMKVHELLKDSSSYKFERYALTAYYNAHPEYTKAYNFPYSTQEICDFCNDSLEGKKMFLK